MSIKILSVGSFLPEKIMTNDDWAQYVDTNDEWINSMTGIKERHIVTSESCIELGVKAAKDAINKSSINGEDIGLFICATNTPESVVPGNAPEIRKQLGIETGIAFDININCTGFVASLIIAESLMGTLNIKYALVIGSETLSRTMDWTDRATCVLFGDGAGAALIERTGEERIFSPYLQGISDKDNALCCYLNTDITPVMVVDETKPHPTKIQMNGRKVYTFALKAIEESILAVLEKANLSFSDIAYIVPHQANIRIVEAAAQRLNLPMDKFYINIEKIGNASSATIPIALNEMNEQNLLNRSDKIIMVGFGGGLAYGAILLEW